MNVETCRSYCLAKTAVTEEFPFGPQTLVFKVCGKMFALAGLENVSFQVSLKCNPEKALELREDYDGLITGAYHMNKRHWNSIFPEKLPPVLVQQMIDDSYHLVVEGLSKKMQHELQKMTKN